MNKLISALKKCTFSNGTLGSRLMRPEINFTAMKFQPSQYGNRYNFAEGTHN